MTIQWILFSRELNNKSLLHFICYVIIFATILLAQFFIKQTLSLFFLMASPVELVFYSPNVNKHRRDDHLLFSNVTKLVNVLPCKTVFDRLKAELVALVNNIWQTGLSDVYYLCNQQLKSENKSVCYTFNP